MMRDDVLVFVLVAVFALGLALWFSALSPTAKLRRRGRKSHSPIISKSRTPMVKFSVRPPKE